MQIVTDRGADLLPEVAEKYGIHFTPLKVTLDSHTYASGVDITPEEFYKLLEGTEDMPLTSQPSVGEFVDLYRQLAQTDPDILSIHISSGLSGTLNSARTAAALVPEANVTLVDTATLSCPEGWQVEAAARAIRGGWSKERILEYLAEIRAQTEGMFTVATLKYLIHGGRISHIKGLMASLLNIKPIIGVAKTDGKYFQLGQEITLKRAILREADLVVRRFGEGAKLRVQLLHANNLPGTEWLRERLSQLFDIEWVPTISITPALGAHVGVGLVGMAVGPAALFASLPG
ncbi:EDD domain protein, DegV family [Longilinea arvoryzae]|uniref:EDD domain protein, DegV family n=1 Tax=Longilinea arvoryzae TaxID=360412 RepID=A0A0S7BIU2_9CHLR|nr:DegV family protein [Longilinea arvoryzae]GAP14374.1 EDD domain protein, DegV family [Longilinea arvoryzae]